MVDGVNIMKFVNDNSSESLKGLNLTRCRGSVLNELKTAFPAVNSMWISFDKMKNLSLTEATGQKLSFFFPNIQKFFVLNPENWSLINGHFPKLIEFSVKAPLDKPNKLDENQVIDFLKNNTQIDTLEIRSPTLKFLREIAVNDILPHLMSLKLNSIGDDYYNGDTIHFSKLKELNLRIKSVYNGMELIFFNFEDFKHLMKFSLHVKPELTEKWFTFINRNVNRELCMFALTTDKLANEQLHDILMKLPTLNDISIKSKSKFTAKNIVDLVERRKFLYNVKFDVLMDKKEQVKLRKDLNSSDYTTTINPFKSARDRVYIQIQR